MENIKKIPLGIWIRSLATKQHDGVRNERAPGPSFKHQAGAVVWFFQNHKWKQRYDPSAKPQASSSKPHAPIFRKRQAP